MLQRVALCECYDKGHFSTCRHLVARLDVDIFVAVEPFVLEVRGSHLATLTDSIKGYGT